MLSSCLRVFCGATILACFQICFLLTSWPSTLLTTSPKSLLCKAWLTRSVSCRLVVWRHCRPKLSVAHNTLTSTMQHLEPCRDFTQLVSNYPHNSIAPIVMLLHFINCLRDVCGPTSDCQQAAGNVIRECCSKWQSNHGVLQ